MIQSGDTSQTPISNTNMNTNSNINTNSNNGTERFSCCITVENIHISLSAPAIPSIVSSYWDEMRVVMVRDGVTQCTRWLSPTMAFRHTHITNSNSNINTTSSVSGVVPDEKRDEISSNPPSVLSPSTIQVQWSSINTAAFNVHFRYLVNRDVDHSLDPGYQRAVYSTNIKYFDAYNTDTADRVRPKVFPKTIHPFIFTVECRKKEKVLDPTRPQDGEQRPTSAGMETVAAYYAKSVSKMSALLKKATAKFNADATLEKNSHENKSVEQSQGQEHHESIGGCFAVYVCTNSNSNSGCGGVDPSEAYNAPGGEKEFHLSLHSTYSHIPSDAKCLPLTLHITMKAHINESPLPPLRDYHDMVILVDQVLVDVMNAEGRRVSKNEFNPKIVESYAFGFTSNTSHTSELSFRSPFLAPPPIREGEDGGVRPVDFSLLHPSQDEHLLTSLDIAKNPTSICIVSSECKNGNKKRIGNRAVSVSRFKTARDGLCKPSYKSQLVMALIRRYNTGEVEVEKCNNPVDLASIINQEYFYDGVRQMEFSLGEYMSFRIRRRCFKDAERYRSELLMPYDYDNSDINCEDLDKNKDAVLFNPQHFSKVLVGDQALPSQQDQDEPQLPQQSDQKNQKKKSSDNNSFDTSNVISANSDFVNVTNTSTSLKKEIVTPVPRLTDDVLTSYNNYEDQSYQPSVQTTLGTSNNTEEEEEKKKLNSYGQKSKSYEANIETSTSSRVVVAVSETFAKQKEMLNPFETGRNPFYSSMSHSSLVGNDDTNGENGNNNLFNQMHTDAFFSYNTENEDVTQRGYPVISFAPYTNQDENNEEDENRQPEEEEQRKSTNDDDDNVTFKPNGGMCTLEVEYQDDIGASNMH